VSSRSGEASCELLYSVYLYLTKSAHVEAGRTSLRPDFVSRLRVRVRNRVRVHVYSSIIYIGEGGLLGDPSGPWVWSGRYH